MSAMNIYLLFVIWGSLTHCISTSSVTEEDVLMESIDRHFYPSLIQKINNPTLDNNANCLQELSQFWNDLDNETRAAYLDSFGKVGPGILAGNVIYLGYYDQCIDIGNTDFCRFPFNVTVASDTVDLSGSIIFEFGMCFPSSCSATDFYHIFYQSDEVIYTHTFTFLDNNFTINVTVPSFDNEPKCPWRNLDWTPSSIIVLTISILFIVLVVIGTIVDVLLWFINDIFPTVHLKDCSEMKSPVNSIDSMSCEVKHSVDEEEPLINVTKSNTIVQRKMKSPANLTDSSCEVKHSVDEEEPLINVAKPITKKVQRSPAETRCIEFLKDLILSFSLYKTMPVIMNTHQPGNAITSINGIRVISMFWVITGHTYLWGLTYGVTANVEKAVEAVPKRFLFQPIDNSFLSVDSFFVLSGLLLSYLAIREMERRKGRFPFVFFYLHRMLRLSPAYYFAIFLNFKLLPYVGTGPLWYVRDVRPCEKYWWTNILYINNFYPTTFSEQCYGVTWYLANDMQFYIISPIFLLLLYHFWKIGFATIAGTMLASIVVIGSMASIKNPDANLLQGTLVLGDESHLALSNFAFSNIYEKPYCRINAYLVGIVLGFIFYKKWRVRPNFWVRICFYSAVWIIAAICCVTIAFGQYQTWIGHPFSESENILFFMFNRTVYSIGIALMVYACHNGFGGIINSFLSWSFWVPPSRLTFMAYLSHPIVLTIMYSTMRYRFIYTDYVLISLIISAVVLSYALALVLAVVVEYPLANVENAIYKFAGVKRRK